MKEFKNNSYWFDEKTWTLYKHKNGGNFVIMTARGNSLEHDPSEEIKSRLIPYNPSEHGYRDLFTPTLSSTATSHPPQREMKEAKLLENLTGKKVILKEINLKQSHELHKKRDKDYDNRFDLGEEKPKVPDGTYEGTIKGYNISIPESPGTDVGITLHSGNRGLKNVVPVPVSVVVKDGKAESWSEKQMKESSSYTGNKNTEWHPDQGDDENEMDLLDLSTGIQAKESGAWKLKAGQNIGYKNYNGEVEKAYVHGFGKEHGGQGRRALHISTPKGHLLLDPFTSGQDIVDLRENNGGENLMSRMVQVINRDELEEQFPISNKGTKYKTFIEIFLSLSEEVNKHGLQKHFAIDYEKDNVESGYCLFEQDPTTAHLYEYTGTAK